MPGLIHTIPMLQELNRCAFGAILPHDLHEVFKTAQTEIRRKGGDETRGIPPGELALVLVPLGELRVQQVVLASELLDQTSVVPAFSLTLASLAGRPNATMPKSVVVELGGDRDRLIQFAQVLRTQAANLFPLPDSPAFDAGLEIARLRSLNDKGRSDLGRALRVAKFEHEGTLKVDELSLLVMTAGAFGPEWQVHRSARLAGSVG